MTPEQQADVILPCISIGGPRHLWCDNGTTYKCWSCRTRPAVAQVIREAVEAESVKLWECPSCGFRMDAAHTDEDGSHSCPACAESELFERCRNLTAQLAETKAELENIRRECNMLIEGAFNSDAKATVLEAKLARYKRVVEAARLSRDLCRQLEAAPTLALAQSAVKAEEALDAALEECEP